MKYQAPALSRGLEILEILSLHQIPLTLSQIAAKLDVSTSQIFRLIYVLVESGYIDKKASDTFTISSKLFSLGMQFITNYSFLDIVMPILKEVSIKTNQSCHCSIKLDDKMVVIAKADSPNSFVFSIRVGHSKDLEQSTSGRVILAHMTKVEQTKFMNKVKHKYDEETLKEISTKIEQIKTQKYIIAPSAFVDGILDIAVPVIAKMSHIGIFCIVIPYVNSSDNTSNKIESLTVLQFAAKKISKLLV